MSLVGGKLPVRRLDLGTFRLVDPDGFGPPPDRQEGRRVLRRAVELGANLRRTWAPGRSMSRREFTALDQLSRVPRSRR